MRSIPSKLYNSPPPTPSSSVSTHNVYSPQRSPWHSPVPYLFGGLAAMLGLIAFALLLLACSYWRLSGQLGDGEDEDVENGSEKRKEYDEKPLNKVYEEKILVIMAGDVRPSFLATPSAVVVTRDSSFEDGKITDTKSEEENIHDGDKKETETPATTAVELPSTVSS
ncbi:hypothetical protein ACFE04_018034 [Oxalis oulophora]